MEKLALGTKAKLTQIFQNLTKHFYEKKLMKWEQFQKHNYTRYLKYATQQKGFPVQLEYKRIIKKSYYIVV